MLLIAVIYSPSSNEIEAVSSAFAFCSSFGSLLFSQEVARNPVAKVTNKVAVKDENLMFFMVILFIGKYIIGLWRQFKEI